MVQYSSSMVSFLAISPLVPFLMSGLHLDCAFKRKGNYTARVRRSEVSVLLRMMLFNGIDSGGASRRQALYKDLPGPRGLCYHFPDGFRPQKGMSSLELSLLIDPPYRREFRADWFRKIVAHVLDVQGISYPTEVGVLITGDDRVAELNRRYRGMEGTTDVLSFSMDGEPVGEAFVSPPDGLLNLGDLIISYPQAERQAREQGHPVRDEVAFLTVHGTFHLLGYDHQEPGEAELMEEMETRALARLGIDRADLFQD